MIAEADLLAGLRGDGTRFARAERALTPLLLRIARRHVASDEVAQEVVQETWLAAWTGASRFEARSTARTWLLRILANRARTRGARDARVVPLSALGDAPALAERVPPWGSPPLADPLRQLLDGEAAAAFAQALARLPARQASAVRRRVVEGEDGERIAADMGVSGGNLRVLLHRGRAGLRSALAPLAA
jgi:RNA polymerase sigma-70 factor (ECF subfamily)